MVISEGVGVAFRDLFPGAPSKVGLFVCLFVFVVLFCLVFFSTNSCPLGQTIRYFTVNWCFKTRIFVFIVDPLITVG